MINQKVLCIALCALLHLANAAHDNPDAMSLGELQNLSADINTHMEGRARPREVADFLTQVQTAVGRKVQRALNRDPNLMARLGAMMGFPVPQDVPEQPASGIEDAQGTTAATARVTCWLCAMNYDEGDPDFSEAMHRPSECAIVSCGHHLCLECFRAYIDSKLIEEIIPCQHSECNCTQCSGTGREDGSGPTRRPNDPYTGDDKCAVCSGTGHAVYEETLEIERYTAEDKYRTRSTKLTENMYQKALGDDWTTCPYDCGGDFMVDAELPYIVAQRCPECNRQVCGKCKQKWIIGSGQTHEDLTCQEWKRRMDPNYAANEAYLARNTKPCPNCDKPIEKDEGCNHMTCRRPSGCGHEFCWTCLGPATRNGPCWISRCRTLSHPVEWR